MEAVTVPSLAELWVQKQDSTIQEISSLGLNDFITQHYDMAERLIAENPDVTHLVATLLQTYIGNPPNLDQDRDLNETDKGGRDDRASGGGSFRDRDSGGSYGNKRGKFDRGGDRGGRSFGNDRGGDRGYGGPGRNFDNPGGRSFTDRGPRPSPSGPRADSEPMSRLMLSIGHEDRVRPGDIVGAIAGEARLPGNRIGHIAIHDEHSFVDVPQALADKVISAMNNNQIKGKRVKVSVAS
jgi:ATP-dependent RNA helicase DeaD